MNQQSLFEQEGRVSIISAKEAHRMEQTTELKRASKAESTEPRAAESPNTSSKNQPIRRLHADIVLEFCKRTDPRYKAIRDEAYVPNHGAGGRQMHFMVWYRGEIAGIISGASSTYAGAARDRFFGITKENRDEINRHIVSNILFRLVNHEPGLASRVVAVWREVTAMIYEDVYGDPVIGFETFVVPTTTRSGTLYRKDGWKKIGKTSGSAKVSKGFGAKSSRKAVERKLVYARKHERNPKLLRLAVLGRLLSDEDGVCHDAILTDALLHPSWRGKSVRDKSSSRILAQRRKALFGNHYFVRLDTAPLFVGMTNRDDVETPKSVAGEQR